MLVSCRTSCGVLGASESHIVVVGDAKELRFGSLRTRLGLDQTWKSWTMQRLGRVQVKLLTLLLKPRRYLLGV